MLFEGDLLILQVINVFWYGYLQVPARTHKQEEEEEDKCFKHFCKRKEDKNMGIKNMARVRIGEVHYEVITNITGWKESVITSASFHPMVEVFTCNLLHQFGYAHEK